MADRPLLIAHRAGNTAAGARAAAGRADAIELDAHVLRGRVEVRHEKVLRPTTRLWERWYLLPAGTRAPAIEEVLAAIDDGQRLHVDLKCLTRRAARRIRSALPPDRELIVSARSWWVLAAFADRPDTTRLRSCGNRLHLRLVGLVPGLGPRLGVVANARLLDPGVVAALLRRSPLLFTWAVTTPEQARALAEAGVTGLIVDDLDIDWLPDPI